MEMPKPTDAHRKLEKLVGNWSGAEQIFPSMWDPKGGTAVGRVQNRLALDGFIVVQDAEQERNGRIGFRGHGVFSWDATDKCYVLHWWDSMGMPPNVFRGNFDGEVLSLTCNDSHGYSRAVWEFQPDSRLNFRLQMSQDANQWQDFIAGNYEREA